MAFALPAPSRFLSAPKVTSKRIGFQSPGDDLDDFLSSDLELSFSSAVSMHSPRHEAMVLSSDAMDVSPLPPACRTNESNEQSVLKLRPRAHTTAARLFGHDLSNSPPTEMGTDQGQTQNRSGWATARRSNDFVTLLDSKEEPSSPDTDTDDAMDIDSSFIAVEKLLIPGSAQPESPPLSPSPLPLSAAPAVAQFQSLFYDTGSPVKVGEQPSSSPEYQSPSPKSTLHTSSRSPSPVLDSSPSLQKLERISSGSSHRLAKPNLEGMGVPINLLKRTRRTAVSAMNGLPNAKTSRSACPVLTQRDLAQFEGEPDRKARRAFSALLPSSGWPLEPSSPDSPFSDDVEASSPIPTNMRKPQVETIEHLGNASLKPPAAPTPDASSPSARYMAAGLSGFGDSEALGKILPCHKVRDDGLMRITCRTLHSLLEGHHASNIAQFHVLDCRFDYEYNGGHIPGAISVNTTGMVEDFLLGPHIRKPKPCTSADDQKKTVLIFHCEFSSKRAPTFAKHLRAKDRALNNHMYPKIHYPEVYILEGGYCQYYREFPMRCQPRGYVSMDDPNHAASRGEGLNQFRRTKFGRVKSYAYGDGRPMFGRDQEQNQVKRNTAPGASGSGTLFAAVNAVKMRRDGGKLVGGLKTLAENGNLTQEEDDGGPEDSPCPPPKSGHHLKKVTNRRLSRAETLGPSWR